MADPTPRKPPQFQVLLALTLVYIIWGSTYLVIRWAVEQWSPFFMGSFRFFVAGMALFLVLKLKGAPWPTQLHWRSAFIVGALLLGGGNGGVVWAEQTVPSGLAALLVSIVPLWMAVFDWSRPGGKVPTAKACGGLALGVVGLILLIGPKSIFIQHSLTPGVVALLIAPIAWGYGSVYAKRAPLPSSPFMSTAMEMLAGSLVLLVMGLISGEQRSFEWASLSFHSWAAVWYLILAGSLIGFTAYIWLLTHVPLSLASTYAFVNPAVAVGLGWLLAHEPLGPTTLLGAAILLTGVALITQESFSKNRKDKKQDRNNVVMGVD